MLSGRVKDNASEGLFFIADFLCLMELTVLCRCRRRRGQEGERQEVLLLNSSGRIKRRTAKEVCAKRGRE